MKRYSRSITLLFVITALSLYPSTELPETDIELNSSTSWKRYSVDIPLNGTHPDVLVFRFLAPKKGLIDIDDITVLP